MAITAQEVNELRKKTNAGMMDCKNAVTEAKGDFEKAIEILRKKGQKISASRADMSAHEGVIFTKVDDKNQCGIIIALSCETDFVAKNKDFENLGQRIAEVALQHLPAQLETLKQLPLGAGTVQEELVDYMGKVGEKMEITAYKILKSELVIPYIHMGNKLGVLLGLSGSTTSQAAEAGRNIAMQIAAMNPIAVDKKDVSQAVVDKELEIAREQVAAESGNKPKEVLEKIVQGRLEKFYKENTLLHQPFIKDNTLTIQAYLKTISPTLTISKFERVAIG